MAASPRPRPIWATVGRMSSPGFSSLSMASPSPTKEDEKGLRASVATSSPRLFAEYGSPGRCGGSGLGSLPGGKTDYDIIRFFTARDIIDLINNLQKSARIAADEAGSIHGDEQANRVKAKCSKVCGLSNRLIDLYVATIKAKVARILRKLGLGQEKGQDLLYSHLMLLQALVDKAFASFNAVQHAEAARIKQAKLALDGRRENSGTLTWRTPATPGERKPASRTGSQGSLPQPAQHMDVKNLLLEARKQFLLMAEELVDLKNKIIVIDRTRIHEAVVAAVAEGDVPDPLPKVKGPPDGIAYGFNTRYVSESSCNSIHSSSKGIFQCAASETGGPALAMGHPLSPRRDTSASSTAHSPRISRLVHATFERPPERSASPVLRDLEKERIHFLSNNGLRSVSLPGNDVGSQAHSPSPLSSPPAPHTVSPRYRTVVSHGGDSECSCSEALSSRQATARDLFTQDKPEETGQTTHSAPFDGNEGQATCHVTRVSLLQRAFNKGSAEVPATSDQAHVYGEVILQPRVDRATASLSVGMHEKGTSDGSSIDLNSHTLLEDKASSPQNNSSDQGEMQAWTSASGMLTSQAATVGKPNSHLKLENMDGREPLRELVLEALRLVERDPQALELSLAALNMSRTQVDEASSRCQALGASVAELQTMLRICLTLLGQQLRSQSWPAAGITSGTDGDAPTLQSCPRCGELAVLLDQILPLITGSCASRSDRARMVDLHTAGGHSEATDSSQDELVLLPLTADIDAADGGDMASEILATVLQRLSTVLDRLRHLEEESAEMEQTLARERQVRTDAEAKAARLEADQNETNAALAVTQQLLTDSERQLEQLRAIFVEVNHDLEAKSVEITAMQQLLQNDGGRHRIAAPSSGMGLFSVGMLSATEMEMEGLRMEHENLRTKMELQGAELRRLQNEALGLRAARDRLVEELQDMQMLLQQRGAASVEDVPLLALKSRSTSDGKAAARAHPRGTPVPVGASSPASKDLKSTSAAGADLALKDCATRASGPCVSNITGQIAPGNIKSKAAASKDLRNSTNGSSQTALRLSDSSAARMHTVKRAIPPASGLLQPGTISHRIRSSSSGKCTPRDHFSALARLEEVQVQLEQAEAARQALECQLQAAQSVIASKDDEIDIANVLLLEYERRSFSAASPVRNQAAELFMSMNSPMLQLTAVSLTGLGSPKADGDASVTSSITPGQRALGDGSCGTLSTQNMEGAFHSHIDLIGRLEELQVQCEELLCRAADLDTQRGRAQLDADERAAELQATKEYIEELESEVELLRELAGKTTQQMQEKEREMAAQKEALLEARAVLARAQAECDMQVSFVEDQAAQLEQAQVELQAAQARLVELEARDEAQSRTDANALACLREKITLMQTEYSASQAALADANRELSAARAAATSAEQIATAQQEAIQNLHLQASENEVIQLDLTQKLACMEGMQSNLAPELAAALENQHQLAAKLEMVTDAHANVAAQLGCKETALQEALARLEQCEIFLRQLKLQLQEEGSEREDLQNTLAVLKAEHADIEKQVRNYRTAMMDLDDKLSETGMAKMDLSQRLDKSVSHCADLKLQLALAQEDCHDREARLETAFEEQEILKAGLTHANMALGIAAAKLATTTAARDCAYSKACMMIAAQHDLQPQIDKAEMKVQLLTNQVNELKQRLQSTQEREAILQEQASRFAAARAAEAEQAVTALQAALADVKARLESVRSEAATQAVKVATLEAKLMQAAMEQERLELQAATATAHSQMLEEQLRQAKAENELLEQELLATRVKVEVQEERSVAQANQLAAAHNLNTTQEEHFSTEMAAVKAQLEVALARNAELTQSSTTKASELEAQLAAARAVTAQQGANSATHARGLEMQLEQAHSAVQQHTQEEASKMGVLGEQLGEARTVSSKQAEMTLVFVEDLESRLASARAAMNEHDKRTSAQVAELEGQLAAARLHSAAQDEQSSTQVSMLVEQLIAARTEMALQAHKSAAHAANLEGQLLAARTAVGQIVEHSAAEVSGLVAQLDAARRSGSAEAEKSARKICKLEKDLATAQAAHAALADRSASRVAELEERLVAALAENTEQAKRSAAQADGLESQLAAALARGSEHTEVQTEQLTLKLEAARAEMSEQAQRSSADAAELVKQLEVAHADISGQFERSAARAHELEEQLSSAYAKNNKLLSQFALESAAWEARIALAQEQHAAQARASAKNVANLEEQLATAHHEIANQMKRSSLYVEALEEQLVAVHTEYAAQSERSLAQTRALEAKLAAAQAAIAEQVQLLSANTAALETELAAARSENQDLAKRFASQKEELEASHDVAFEEQILEAQRLAVNMAYMEAQLLASKADTIRHARRAEDLATAFEEQLVTAHGESTVRAEQMHAMVTELRTVVCALETAKACQEKHDEDVTRLLAADLEQRKLLDLHQAEAKKLKETMVELQLRLAERESAVTDREVQLSDARQELEAVVAALGLLQATVERLQNAASAATAAGAAASNAAAVMADQQQANLAIIVSEHARLRGLRSELDDNVNQPHMASGPKAEVATFKILQDSAGKQLTKAGDHASMQSSTVAEERVLQCLKAIVEAQAHKLPDTSSRVQNLDELTEAELTCIHELLKSQHGASADLLQALAIKLAAADDDLRDAKVHVEELQSQLADATGRIAAAEQAALTADVEKRKVEACLTVAIADSEEGRAMVQELTSELARYREEVELIRKSILAKQVLMEQPNPKQQQPLEIEYVDQSNCEPSTSMDMNVPFDAELAEDFLEGCLWGIGFGGPPGLSTLLPGRPLAVQAPVQQPEDNTYGSDQISATIIHRPGQSAPDQAGIESPALRLRAGGNVLELMSKGWHGSRLGVSNPLAGLEPPIEGVRVTGGAN